MLSCNRAVEGSGLQNRCGEIPVAGSNPADSSTFWRCRTVGLVQEFAKLPGGVSCLEGSNPSISANYPLVTELAYVSDSKPEF